MKITCKNKPHIMEDLPDELGRGFSELAEGIGEEQVMDINKTKTTMLEAGGVITGIVEARVSVRVRVGNREAEGAGSIYLSDLWAWPASGLSRAEKVEAMKRLCLRLAATLPEATGGEPCHPLELGLRLHHAMVRDGDEAMPILARSVCASPFDVAVHDAAGQALGCGAFQFYDEGARLPAADRYFARLSTFGPRCRGFAWGAGPAGRPEYH